MPYEIMAEAGLIVVKLSGRLTMDEMLACAHDLGRVEVQERVDPHRLIDLSAVDDGGLDFARLDQFSAQRRGIRLRNRVKSAIIAGTAGQQKLARLFQVLNANPGIQIEVFQDRAGALHWLGL